jgi:hypothetical protein
MNMRVIVLVLVLGIGALGYFAWQKNSTPARQDQMPPQGEMPPQVDLPAAGDPGLDWDAPSAWSSEPGRGMRLATYTIPGDKGAAECAVFYFGPGQGGPVDANIQRWIGEFANASKPDRSTKKVGDFTVNRVRLKGTWASHSMSGGEAGVPIADHELLGAIVETPVGSVFFKLTGPSGTVDAAVGGFDKMIGSVRRKG